jgi:hypothetical protein
MPGMEKTVYENITVRLPTGTLAQIEATRELRESKLEFIRRAVANEIGRRAAKAKVSRQSA